MQDRINGQMGDAQIDKINFFCASQRYALPLYKVHGYPDD
jgi:hypothetical protein